MISVVLPYWDRKHATDKALARMADLYPRLYFEVIVVDDGSPEPYIAPDVRFPVRVIRLEAKTSPKNPCIPINVGVAASVGDIVAISNPEILHRGPVLPQLRDEVQAGHMTYAIAACWAPETNRWHAHSTRTPLYADRTEIVMPKGAQYHFLSMMRRTLWDKSGGFDESYRDGAGYDDNDFLMKLDRAGAHFVMRDDLVVDHPRNGARAKWTPEMFLRNRALFVSKWS